MPVIPHGSDTPSPRLKLPGPILTDPADVPLDIRALRDALDPVTVVFMQGLASAMPAAGVSGRYYWATDTKVLFYDDGTTWYQPGAMSPGDIKPTAASLAPLGWLLCDGAQYSRSTYAVLFNAIGLSWTTTDDGATFNVPDLRGRTPIGAGQGAGLTNHLVGQRGGAEAHALTAGEMPSHGHGVNDPTHVHGLYDPSHTHGATANDHVHNLSDPGHIHQSNLSAGNCAVVVWTSGAQGQQWTTGGWGWSDIGRGWTGQAMGGATDRGVAVGGSYTGQSVYGAATGISVAAAGGSGAHANMPPWAAVNWLIKT